MNKNYIVLNGKHYDAVTGALIKTTAKHSQSTHTRIAPAKTVEAATHSTHTPDVHHATKKTVSRTHHQTPKIVHSHKQQHPKTLMRHVVKKPVHNQKPTVKQAYPLAKNHPSPIKPKISATGVDGLRSRRAQEIHKSKQVSRFAVANTAAIPAKLQPITPKAAPNHVRATPSHHASIKHPATAAQTPSEKKTALLEQALANAKSHEEPAPKVSRSFKHRRIASSLAGLAAVFVICGFVAYLNKASVELQVASVRAGFQASMPNYTPSGYERQAAKAVDGKVAFNFVSPVQKSDFTLTQESSSWDSQTLFDSVVAQGNATYQTVQSHGRTIYIYDGDKAAWVDGGILYKVSGDTKLNSDQVISLATSM